MEQVVSFTSTDLPRLTKEINEFLKTNKVKCKSISHTVVYKPIQTIGTYVTTQKEVSAILIYEDE